MRFTDKGPAIDIMNHLKAKIDDTATLEGKLEKATIYFDEKMILLQDYISKNAIIEKELADGRYSELEKDHREALVIYLYAFYIIFSASNNMPLY